MGGDRPLADIPSKLHAVEADVGSGLVRRADGGVVGRATTDHGDHAAARRHELSVLLSGGRMKKGGVRDSGGVIEACDDLTRLGSVRISPGCEDHAHAWRLTKPYSLRQGTGRSGGKEVRQRLIESRQQHLSL